MAFVGAIVGSIALASIIVISIVGYNKANVLQTDYNNKMKDLVDQINAAQFYEYQYDKYNKKRTDNLVTGLDSVKQEYVKHSDLSASTTTQTLNVADTLTADKSGLSVQGTVATNSASVPDGWTGVNMARRDGRWSHFDWVEDGKNYLRGDTIVDGKVVGDIRAGPNTENDTYPQGWGGGLLAWDAVVKASLLVGNKNGDNTYISGSSISTPNGIQIGKNDPGPMVEKKYNNNNADRYGVGQYGNGRMRMYTATAYPPATVGLGFANAKGEIDDILVANRSGAVSIKGAVATGNSTVPDGWSGVNMARRDGRWSHFDWVGDGKNYLRGDTVVDGNISLQGDKGIAKAGGPGWWNGITQVDDLVITNTNGQSTTKKGITLAPHDLKGGLRVDGQGTSVAGTFVAGAGAPPGGDWTGVNMARRDGRWTHFDWVGDGKNYVRGDTVIDGNLSLGDKGIARAGGAGWWNGITQTDDLVIMNANGGSKTNKGITLAPHDLKNGLRVDGKGTAMSGAVATGNSTVPDGWAGVNMARRDGRWSHFDWVGDGKNYLRGDTVVDGGLSLQDNPMFIRGQGDANHVLQWTGAADGPRLTGCQGGQLNTVCGGEKNALSWDISGTVNIPGKLCIGPPNNSWCFKPNPNNTWLDISRNGAVDGPNQPMYHLSQDGNMWFNRALNGTNQRGWIV